MVFKVLLRELCSESHYYFKHFGPFQDARPLIITNKNSTSLALSFPERKGSVNRKTGGISS